MVKFPIKGQNAVLNALSKGYKLRMDYFGPGAYIQFIDNKIVNHNKVNWGPKDRVNYALCGEWYEYKGDL